MAVTVVPAMFKPFMFCANSSSWLGALKGMVSFTEPLVGEPSVVSSSTNVPLVVPPSASSTGASAGGVELAATTQPSRIAPNAEVWLYGVVLHAGETNPPEPPVPAPPVPLPPVPVLPPVGVIGEPPMPGAPPVPPPDEPPQAIRLNAAAAARTSVVRADK